MPEKESFESEVRIEEVLASLSEKHQKEEMFQQETPDDWFEKSLKDLPSSARDDIRAHAKSLEEAGVTNEKKLTAFVQREIDRNQITYHEKRFTVGEGEKVLKEAYSKEQFVAQLRDIFREGAKPEDLQKIARLSFDANGLKAMNDLSASHEKGTEYLKRIADVFHDPESSQRKRMEELGLGEILFTTGAGDEYSLLVRSEEPIEPAALDEAARLYEDAIAQIDVSDLVDLKDMDTRLRYMGISQKEYDAMSDEEQTALAEKMKAEIPDDFEMKASASGGAATALDGLYTAMRHETKPMSEEDSYSASLDKIMGGLWDASDNSALENKIVYKAELREGDAAEKFYSKVLARTTEARVMEEKVQTLEEKVQRQKVLLEEINGLAKLLTEGVIDTASFAKQMAEKQAELG